MVESHGVESHCVETHCAETHCAESLAGIPAGTYRHYKGNLYEVIGAATHSETEELLVVYRALYGEFGLWVRPLEMFLGDVEVDGRSMRRFAPV